MEEIVQETEDLSVTCGDNTSPSQLQEVTLDQDVTFSNSMAGGGRSPSARGRSVKEFEEQLANLKKENFNLKLRIYFLEERMGSNFNLDKEDVVKKNVELMVEVESLRKEVQEKHELLCQAVKAMELEDEEHKKMTVEKDSVMDEYRQEIECLRTQLHEKVSETRSESPRSFFSAQTDYFPSIQLPQDFTTQMKELQEKIVELEKDLKEEKESGAAVQLLIDQREATIRTLTGDLDEANRKLAVSEVELSDLRKALEESQIRKSLLAKKLQEKQQRQPSVSDEMCAGLRDELERERRRYDKLRVTSDQKIAELQTQLEASMCELKKSQELVVASKSPSLGLRSIGTDSLPMISVSKPTTPPRPARKDPFAVQSPLPSPPSSLPLNHHPSVAIPQSPLSSPSSPHQAPSPSCEENVVQFDFEVLEKNLQEICGGGGAGVSAIGEVLERLKGDREALQGKIVKLKAEQLKACKIIKSMIDSRNKSNEEMSKLRKKNEELEHELENVVSKPLKAPDVLHRSSTMEGQGGDLVEHYKILTDELEEKIEILEATLTEKDSQMRRVQEQYEEILKSLKKKEDHIVDLEFEVLSANQEKDKGNSSTTNISGIATPPARSYLATLLDERDAEIERLNGSLAKRNCDLQGLVNNELWHKNREIEKLERRHATEVLRLQGELSSKDIQLRLIKEKISEAGIDIDSNGNNSGEASENRQHTEEEEIERLKLELQKSEQLRSEAQEVCTVLSGRLEELAVFLDSLLKQKSVLGFLGGKENKRLRQIIDQSLDLSRSFTASMMVGNPNESLLQLSNLTSLLNDTNGENVSLTFKSHLYSDNGNDASSLDNGNSEMVIATLRQQIVNLKYELQLRDVELNRLNNEVNIPIVDLPNSEHNILNTTSTTLKYHSDNNQSESESWSEPDRVVSRARIGLDIDSSSMSLPNAKSNPSSDSTDEMLTARSLRTPPKRHLLDKQMLSEQLEAEKADNAKLRATLEALEDQLAKSTEAIETLRIDAKEKIRSKIVEIEIEKREALSIAKEAEEVAGLAKDEIRSAEAKLRSVQKEMSELDAKLRLQYENEFVNSIKSATQQAEEEISSLRQMIEELRLDCARNCVRKTELVATREDLERVQKLLRASEETNQNLAKEYKNVKDKLSATQERLNELRNELDTATLQYSEAVLEKTKIANEKASLEQELSLTALKEVDLRKQFDEIQMEMSNIKLSYQRQIGSLQQHKARLEMRASELESANAELHNRLIKIGCGDAMFSSSLPNSSHFGQLVAYRRQVSDVSTSDDSRQPHLIPGRSFALNPVDFERNEANSSPDLGIESDHGRFSSLETVPRPLIHTLDFTESMGNVTEGDNQTAVADDDNQHCCRKSLEMAHENSDLKRKLLRTRRALEETVTQLSLANQRKKQVEKTICKQIHKTSQVLRKAKANLDSGSESEVQKRL